MARALPPGRPEDWFGALHRSLVPRAHGGFPGPEGPSQDCSPVPLVLSPGNPFFVRTVQPGDRPLPSPSEPHSAWAPEGHLARTGSAPSTQGRVAQGSVTTSHSERALRVGTPPITRPRPLWDCTALVSSPPPGPVGEKGQLQGCRPCGLTSRPAPGLGAAPRGGQPHSNAQQHCAAFWGRSVGLWAVRGLTVGGHGREEAPHQGPDAAPLPGSVPPS